MVKIRIPKPSQPPRATLETEINRLKQELETERSSNKQLRASIDVMQIGWDLDKQKLSEVVAKLDKCSVSRVQDIGTNTNSELEVPNLTLQSEEAHSASASVNEKQADLRLLTCSLCCKETFPNVEQFQKHLHTVGANLVCPFCVRHKCVCSLNKHLDKGCPKMNKSTPFKLTVQTNRTKEAQTQTNETASTFSMQDLLANVSVKMVHTLDKNGVKRILPHITMEPFSTKVNVQNTNAALNESTTAVQLIAGASNVQKVPADSTGTHSVSQTHPYKSQPDNSKTSVSEKLLSNSPQNHKKTARNECVKKLLPLESVNQKDKDKLLEKSSPRMRSREDKEILGETSNSLNNTSKTNSKVLEKSVSNINNESVQKLSLDVFKSKHEKSAERVKKLVNSESTSDQDDKGKDKHDTLYVSKEQSKDKSFKKLYSLGLDNKKREKYLEKSPSLDNFKREGVKKNVESFSRPSSSIHGNKRGDESVAKSPEFIKSVGKKHSKQTEKSSVSKQQGNVHDSNSEHLTPVLKSKGDKQSLKSVSKNQNYKKPSTTSFQNKNDSKDEVKKRKVGRPRKNTSLPSNGFNSGGSGNGSDKILSGSKVSKDNSSGSHTKGVDGSSNAGRSVNSSNSEGNSSDDFYCSACEVYFKSVVQHLEIYHNGEEVEIEDEAYQEVPNDLRQKLVCKAGSEDTEKVKQMLLNNIKNTESNKIIENRQENNSSKRKKTNSIKSTSESKKMKMDKSCEPALTDNMNKQEEKKNTKEMTPEVFKCKYCEEVFPKRLALQRHACKGAAITKEYVYDQCNEVLPSSKLIDTHVQMHKEQAEKDVSPPGNDSKKPTTKVLHTNEEKLKSDNQMLIDQNMLRCEVLLKDICVKRKCSIDPDTPMSEGNTESHNAKRALTERNKEIDGVKISLNVDEFSEPQTSSDKDIEIVKESKKEMSEGRKPSTNNNNDNSEVKEISIENITEANNVEQSKEISTENITEVNGVEQLSTGNEKAIDEVKKLQAEKYNNEVDRCSTKENKVVNEQILIKNVKESDEVKKTSRDEKTDRTKLPLMENSMEVDNGKPVSDDGAESQSAAAVERTEEIDKDKSLCASDDGAETQSAAAVEHTEEIDKDKEDKDIDKVSKIVDNEEKNGKEKDGKCIKQKKEQQRTKNIEMKNKKQCSKESVDKPAGKAEEKTGAGDYWKNWREELKNDPEKWESFLVEEQERFKEKLGQEKQLLRAEVGDDQQKKEKVKVGEDQQKKEKVKVGEDQQKKEKVKVEEDQQKKEKVKVEEDQQKKEKVKVGEDQQKKEKEEFECTKCKVNYHTAHALTVHIEAVHALQSQNEEMKPPASEVGQDEIVLKTSDNVYKCVLCLSEFTSLRQAEKHKLLHDKEDAFHCSYCPCVYQLRLLLEEHVRNEHGKSQSQD